MLRQLPGALPVLLVALAGSSAAWAQCPLDWTDGFGPRGLSGEIHAMAVFDDGSGPALYVGGGWLDIGGPTPYEYLVKWDGAAWTAVDPQPDRTVYALQALDLGDGPALYVGGSFDYIGDTPISAVARWDGITWSSLGELDGDVYAIACYNDATGPALYVGGEYLHTPELSLGRIARWDGAQWSTLGEGLSDGTFFTRVSDLAVFDDGTGPALYAAGNFSNSGELVVVNVGRWDGVEWSALGYGVSGGSYNALALCVYDPPGIEEPALIVGGDFVRAGGEPVNGIARWDGENWSALGNGFSHPGYSRVNALEVYTPTGSDSPLLYVGGRFLGVDDVESRGIVAWNGSQWSALGEGLKGGWFAEAIDLVVFDPPGEHGPGLYLGGDFTVADDVLTPRIGGSIESCGN